VDNGGEGVEAVEGSSTGDSDGLKDESAAGGVVDWAEEIQDACIRQGIGKGPCFFFSSMQ
jgi:hypothetical protein